MNEEEQEPLDTYDGFEEPEFEQPEQLQVSDSKDSKDRDPEYQVPSSPKDLLELTKQDLRLFIEPLSYELLETLKKLKIAQQNDNFALICSELPLFAANVENYVATKRRDCQNVETNMMKLLEDFEKRAEKAEEKNKLYEQLVQKLNDKNGLLQNENRDLNKERINDLKKDPVRNAVENFMLLQLDELNAKKSVNMVYTKTKLKEKEQQQEVLKGPEKQAKATEPEQEEEEKKTEDKKAKFSYLQK